jgi:hypothetical protein
MGKDKDSKKGITSGQYLMADTVPFVLCLASLEVVLKHSEKAKGIFEEIVQCYELPDVKKAFEALRNGLPTGTKLATEIRRSSGLDKDRETEDSELCFPDGRALAGVARMLWNYARPAEAWMKVKNGRVRNDDFALLVGKIQELVKVGFNNEADQSKGRFKITALGSKALVVAVVVRTFLEHYAPKFKGWDKIKVAQYGNHFYTMSDIMSQTVARRFHDQNTKAFKRAGYRLHHPDKLAQGAERWYQCRVIYSGTEEYCRHLTSGETLDSGNVSNEIKPFDDALGYRRRSASSNHFVGLRWGWLQAMAYLLFKRKGRNVT